MSASYSRVRESASCMSPLRVGAKISSAIASQLMETAPISTRGMFSRNRIWPSIENQPVIRLVTSARPMTQVSLLRTWLTSWASTPASSRGSSCRSMPSVTATAASSRDPSAKAFIIALGTW